MTSKRKPSQPRSAKREDEERAAFDEEMLRAAAWAAFNAAVGAVTPASDLLQLLHDDAALDPVASLAASGMQPPEAERLVIHNFKAEPGFVPVGQVELELEPGQGVVLWVNRGTRLPLPAGGEGDVPTRLVILADDDDLLA